MRDAGIPVTVLSGPLGAGKTTVLNHLLTESGGREIAVLVNDMGEINVDADHLTAGTTAAADGGVVELSNGCICCELQDDLETEVTRLAGERDFEYLVVEASGISEPAPVARLFTTGSAAAAYDLDALVTVVDARRFLDTFGDSERVERQTAPGSDDRPLSDLLVEQVEFADVILLNKCDLADEAELDRVEELLGALNPGAQIYRTVHGEIDPGRVVGTGLFDPDAAADGTRRGAPSGPADLDEHAGDTHEGSGRDGGDHGHEGHAHDHGEGHEHAHPEEVYGVTSFAFRRRRPFHPVRFREALADLPPSVVRSKGLCWVAGRDDLALLYSQAGPTARIEAVGPWIAGLPEVEREMYRENRDLPWHDEHGDRRTELVFIGQEMDEAAIRERFEACLVTDEERGAGLEADWYPGETGDAVEF